MKIVVAGTGYVGLVAAVAFAEIGNNVTCVDVNKEKIEIMRQGISPIYEDGLEELMKKNHDRITYTDDYKAAYRDGDVIFIGVGTPEQEDGSANLTYVYDVCNQIIESINKDTVVVIKSTVPLGTNDKIDEYFKENIKNDIKVAVVSNPEFLAQGTAVQNTLYGPRIIVGIKDKWAEKVIDELYAPLTSEPYNQVLLKMNRTSAELTKYASNDFLALKISYINEIANICDLVNANITDVTKGMGLDERIGNKFLNAGIGYGGSCFPKDTKALYWKCKELGYEARLVKETIEVNKTQKIKLFNKAYKDFNGNFKNKKIAILGATFKPGTDDVREAPSIENIKLLNEYGAKVFVYDPVGLKNIKKIFKDSIEYVTSIEDALIDADICFIMTEWKEVKEFSLEKYEILMKNAVLYDGRNCYELEDVSKYNIKYTCIGRN